MLPHVFGELPSIVLALKEKKQPMSVAMSRGPRNPNERLQTRSVSGQEALEEGFRMTIAAMQ